MVLDAQVGPKRSYAGLSSAQGSEFARDAVESSAQDFEFSSYVAELSA